VTEIAYQQQQKVLAAMREWLDHNDRTPIRFETASEQGGKIAIKVEFRATIWRSSSASNFTASEYGRCCHAAKPHSDRKIAYRTLTRDGDIRDLEATARSCRGACDGISWVGKGHNANRRSC